MPATRVSFAGPGKTPAELTQAVAAGVTIEMESPTEAERVATIGAQLGIRPRVAVRVNPDFAVKGSGMRMGGGPQQFGVDAEQVPALLARARRTRPRAARVPHLRRLAEPQRRAAVRGAAQDRRARAAPGRRDRPQPIRYLNLGGGFGIPYFEKDEPLDLAAIGDNLDGLLDDVVRPALPEARVVIELGRYIVGEAGVYVTRVVDRRCRAARPSWSSTAACTTSSRPPATSARSSAATTRSRSAAACADAATETVNVVGLPVHAARPARATWRCPVADIGDLVVVFQAGAYGLTASPTAFLSHPAPAEVLV